LERRGGFGETDPPILVRMKSFFHAGKVLESTFSKSKSKSKTISDHP
jgi:hypothetical protein